MTQNEQPGPEESEPTYRGRVYAYSWLQMDRDGERTKGSWMSDMTDGIVMYPRGEAILRMQCLPVEAFDSELQDVVADMIEVLGESNGLALAAPQIGLPLQLFVYDMGDVSGVVCNPSIVASSDDLWTFNEGCLSIPGRFWYVNRPRTVTMTFRDSNGDERTLTESDLFGRMVQHEVDHLNGRLVVDLLSKHYRKQLHRALGEG